MPGRVISHERSDSSLGHARQSIHNLALRASGFGGEMMTPPPAIRFSSAAGDDQADKDADDASSSHSGMKIGETSSDSGGNADSAPGGISELLASQQRMEKQLSFLNSRFKDVRRCVMDIHRAVTGNEGTRVARDEDPEVLADDEGLCLAADGDPQLEAAEEQSLEEDDDEDFQVGRASRNSLEKHESLQPEQHLEDGDTSKGPREMSKQLERAMPDDGLEDLEDDEDHVRAQDSLLSASCIVGPMAAGSASTAFYTAGDIDGRMSMGSSKRVSLSAELVEELEAGKSITRQSLNSTASDMKSMNSLRSSTTAESIEAAVSVARLLNHLDDRKSVNPKSWRPPPSLPQDWPGMLQLRPGLSGAQKGRTSKEERSRTLYMEDVKSIHGHDMLAMADNTSAPVSMTQRKYSIHRFVMRPVSLRRIVLDIVGLFVLGYDLFLTPFLLAWDISLVGTIRAFAWASVSFWTIDMVASFLTGFYKNGLLEMRPGEIAKRYLQSWFMLDMIVISCDTFSLLTSEAQGTAPDAKAAGILRFSKLSRMIRIVTVLRLTRLADISQRLTDWGMTQRWTILAEITKLLVSILWLSHSVSCAWWAVGRHGPTDTGGRWVRDEALPSIAYMDTPMEFQYTTCLHWALAQITPGSMSVQPFNTSERIFNVVCLLCGLFFFTSLISSLSTKMVHFRMMKQEEAMMFVRLRNYLLQEQVNQQLAVTIQKQLRDRLARRKMLAVEDVPAIAYLSLSTRMDLHFEVCKPHLRHYPFFHLWANIDVTSFRKFCFKAIAYIYLPQGETLFLPGTPAKEAYYLCEGHLSYHPEVQNRIDDVLTPSSSKRGSGFNVANSREFVRRMTTGSRELSPHERSLDTAKAEKGHHPMPHLLGGESVMVDPGAWLCEAALWTQWLHVGTTIAGHSRCKLMTCNGAHFVKDLMAHRLTRPIAIEYGESYHARLTRSFPPHCAAPDDLHVPQTSPEEIALCLSSDVRTFISTVAFNTLSSTASAWISNGSVKLKCAEELCEEVLEGKTALTFDPIYTVMRVVQLSIAIVTLVDEPKFLVQLGKEELHSRKIRFSAVYPGIKQVANETPTETTGRLLSTTLQPFSAGLTLGKTYLETDVKLSTRYNLQTKYLRTVQEMTLDGTFFKQRKRKFTLIHPKASVHSASTEMSVGHNRFRWHSLSSSRSLDNDDTVAQLSSKATSRTSAEKSGEHLNIHSNYVLRKLRPRRVLQNVFGYVGEVDPVDIVEKTQLFLMHDDDGCVVCAWLTQEDFDVLANPANAEYLQHWFRDHVSVEDVFP